MTTQASSQWQSQFHAILLHPVEPSVLMLSGGDGWSLPRVVLDGKVWPSEANSIMPVVRAMLGHDVTMLRHADVRIDHVARAVDAVIVLERHGGPPMLPEGAVWIGRKRLADLPVARPEHRPILDACLNEAEGGPRPALRPPWARSGWFDQAVAWIHARLHALGYVVTAPIDQVRSWGISCVLRAPTAAGDIYFKGAATLPLFADEPSLMTSLAERFPVSIPAPIAIDRRQRWMLMADFGSRLRGRPEASLWQKALGVFAEIQRASADRVETLLAMGCVDRRLERLAQQVDALLGDADILSGLSATEVGHLQALAPRLKAMCAELADLGVPETLVHGDLHAGNIALRDGSCLFFDWTDGCIAHPFFDLVTFLQDADRLADAPGARVRLRDAYLEPWTAAAPMTTVRVAWLLAAPLGALHQAVSYQHILKNVEPASRPELDWTSFCLREVLRTVDERA